MKGPQSVMLIVIVIIFIRIRTSQAACRKGWFGTGCKKQCHCAGRDPCNVEGGCPHKCESTYYGPSCQVFDAMQAYGTGLNKKELLDQDLSTCVESTASIAVKWNMSIQFTAARLEFSPNTDVYDVTNGMTISFKSSSVSCGQMGKVFNGHIVDINCGHWTVVKTNGFTLTFPKEVALCNLYVKIGVDVALKARATDTAHEVKGDLYTLDNINNGDYTWGFWLKKCYVTKSTSSGWKLNVHPEVKTRILFARVLLPTYHPFRMNRFETATFDHSSHVISKVINPNKEPPSVNNFVLSIKSTSIAPVARLEISSPNDGPLQVCGVMAYADLMYNEPCIHSEHCQPEHECYKGHCQCLLGLSRYNKSTHECEHLKRPLEDCKSDDDCIINSTCQSNKCMCESETHYHNEDAGLCHERLPYGRLCKTDDYCVKEPYYGCSSKGFCDCIGSSYWDENKTLCIGVRFFSEDCVRNEDCNLNTTCISNVCQCKDDEFNRVDTKTCEPRLPHGSECDRDYYCLNAPHYACVEGRCGCDTFSYWDEEQKMCIEEKQFSLAEVIISILLVILVLVFCCAAFCLSRQMDILERNIPENEEEL